MVAKWDSYSIPELVAMALCKLLTKEYTRKSGLGYNLKVHTQ